MRPPLPSAPPGQNELPLAALGPPDSAGKWVGGARRDVKAEVHYRKMLILVVTGEAFKQ